MGVDRRRAAASGQLQLPAAVAPDEPRGGAETEPGGAPACGARPQRHLPLAGNTGRNQAFEPGLPDRALERQAGGDRIVLQEGHDGE